MYGRNCSETCGFCLGKEQCHVINGVCANGCSDGFLGTRCTEGNYSYVFSILNFMYADAFDPKRRSHLTPSTVHIDIHLT